MNSTRRTEGTTRQKCTSSSATSLSKLARRYGILGVFGEEGSEAVHAGGSAVRINENPTSKASGDKEAPGGKATGKTDSACEKKSGDQKEAPELGSGGTAGRRRRAVKFLVG